MQDIRRCVGAGMLDIFYADQLKTGLGLEGGVKGNVVKEMVLDRKCEAMTKKSAFKGITKFHHRKYFYDDKGKFTDIKLFETSFSDGKGLKKNVKDLEEMMVGGAFQPQPETKTLVGVSNPRVTVSEQFKKENEEKREQKKQKISHSRKERASRAWESVQQTKQNSKVHFCQNSKCYRAFSKLGNLQRHVCKNMPSKNPRRNSRSKKLVTSGEKTKDVLLNILSSNDIVAKATLIKPSAITKESHAKLLPWRKVHTMIDGSKWKNAEKLKAGHARKDRFSTRKRYSSKQANFLIWAYSLGVQDINRKLQPEKAADLMKIVGTAEGAEKYPTEPYMKQNEDGKPTFLRNEWVEKYEIKSWFSTKRQKLLKQMSKNIK